MSIILVVMISRPSWILLHGLGDGPSTWTGLADQLRSHGDSVMVPDLTELVDAEPAMATIETAATAVARAVRTATRPETGWLLVGHSLGGLVAIALAEQLEGVRGVALIEGSIRPGDADVVRGYAAAGDGYGRLLAELTGAASRSAIEETYLANLRRTPPSMFWALAGELVARQVEFSGRFARLALPRIYLASTDSRAACASPVATLAATGADVATVPETNHWLHAERPNETADILLDWSARLGHLEPPD